MTPERWAEIQEQFHRIREAHSETRTALLSDLDVTDPDLAQEVRALLDAAEQGPLLSDPYPESGELAAEFVGPFRLLKRLGEGGMGTVFLAQREEQGFKQRVALKLLRSGFASSRLAQHVAHERNVLARLEHPNIARLIDGGTTPGGQPYLAMEYIEGETLLAYCGEADLTLTAKIRLFLEICDAVHYAHTQLVVHRDLKPSNVMVGRDRRPRLLDFGVAKLLDPDPDGELTVTAPWLTPAYASPEQVRGRATGTPSDIYTLGIILHELLTGIRPYEVDGLSPAAIERQVCDITPPKPSERQLDPRVARVLRGDLDLIILKALAKEPARRYPSAERFAQDLRNFLEGLPVSARPDSVAYRLRKLARRNRTAVILGTAAVLSLVVGIGAVVRQGAIARRERDRAETARQQAEGVTAFIIGLFEGSDTRGVAPDTVMTRALLREGLAQAEALSGQPLVQASMLDALAMVLTNVDEYERAESLLSRSTAIRTARLPPDHPDLATSLAHEGNLLRRRSRYPEALERYQAALAMRQRAFGRMHPDVATSYRDLGFILPYVGRDSASVNAYREALAIDRVALGEESGQTAQDLALVGLALRRIGAMSEAIGLLRESIARKTRVLGPEDPETARTKFHLGDVLAAAGEEAEAEREYRGGIAIRRKVLGDADVGRVHGLENLAELLGQRGEGREAESLLREALALRRYRYGTNASSYAESLGLLANELVRQRRFADALPLREQSIAIWTRLVGPDHAAVAGGLANLVDIHLGLGRLADAERVAREALRVRQMVYGEHVLTGKSLIQLARVLDASGSRDEAAAAVYRGREIIHATAPVGSPDRLEADTTYARIIGR